MGVYEVYTIARVYVSMHVGKNPDNILLLSTKMAVKSKMAATVRAM